MYNNEPPVALSHCRATTEKLASKLTSLASISSFDLRLCCQEGFPVQQMWVSIQPGNMWQAWAPLDLQNTRSRTCPEASIGGGQAAMAPVLRRKWYYRKMQVQTVKYKRHMQERGQALGGVWESSHLWGMKNLLVNYKEAKWTSSSEENKPDTCPCLDFVLSPTTPPQTELMEWSFLQGSLEVHCHCGSIACGGEGWISMRFLRWGHPLDASQLIKNTHIPFLENLSAGGGVWEV